MNSKRPTAMLVMLKTLVAATEFFESPLYRTFSNRLLVKRVVAVMCSLWFYFAWSEVGKENCVNWPLLHVFFNS